MAYSFYRSTINYVSSILKPLGPIYRWTCYLIVGFSIAAVLGVVAWSAYDDWSRQREIEKQAKEKQSVGTQASIAGIELWAAYKACTRIGINSIDQCAKYEGQLLQEVAAPQLAKVALDARSEYYKLCERFYTEESCIKLLNRSWYLSQNTGE